ncbi:MAG: hypothetical protein OZ948_10235 [Deltaproteobacteria bacterium]|nr:hypothetical protein [Deltaproteobacteria bacterium]
MAVLQGIGLGSFVLASLAVGTRLLLLARRTRAAPEGALGAALLLGGGIGYLLMVLALDLLPRPWAPAALLLANLSLHAGALFLAIGTAHIFRPGDPRGRAIVTAIALVLGFSYTLRLGDARTIPPAPVVFWTSTIGSAAAYAWSAAEAGRYAALLRRRVRLRLADPAVTRRIVLWSAACSAAVAIHAATAANRFLTAQGTHPAVLALSSALGLGAAGCLWLAFRRARTTAGAVPGAA